MATLPFLPMAAAVMAVAELVKTVLPGYPRNANFACLDFPGSLDDFLLIPHGPRPGCICEGHQGGGLVWPETRVQRCAVHKLRNLERKTPKPALAELRADFHRIVYAETLAAARGACAAFERKWRNRCRNAVRSLQEGGEELLTFFSSPRANGRRSRPRM